MRSQSGFTLLEVMVATTVMAVGLVGALELFTGSTRLASATTKQTEALVLARSVMDGLLWRSDLDDGEERGTEGNYKWTSSVARIKPQLGASDDIPPDTDSKDYELKELLVTVSWQGLLGAKRVHLSSARIAERF